MAGAFKQLSRRAHLHRTAARHHHHVIGKGQRLHLIVRDVDHGQLELVVNLLDLAPQLPFQMRIDHRQRLIEQHRRHIGAHQATAQGYFLFFICRQVGGKLVQLAAHFQHLGNLAHPFFDLLFGHLPIAQGKGQVFRHRHGVVNHRKLKHLGNVAGLRRGARDIDPIKTHAALRRRQQARHDVEQGGLAAA